MKFHVFHGLKKYSPATLTLTLRTSATNSICPQPLYLLTWSPSIESSGATQAIIEGSIYYAVKWEDTSGSVDIQYDLANRPCRAAPSALEYAVRLNPFPDEARLLFTPNSDATGGSLSAMAPGAYALPKTVKINTQSIPPSKTLGGMDPIRTTSTREGDTGSGLFIFFDPAITYGESSGGCGSVLTFDSSTGRYGETYEYPLNSGCLWRNWYRDGTGAHPYPSEAVITYGDESLSDYFTEDIDYEDHCATGTIRFGGQPVWSGTACYHVEDGCYEQGVELLSSDPCDDVCSGCVDGNCDALEGDSLGSLAFRIPLGAPRDLHISGFLWFSSDGPVSITPSTFNLLARPDATITDTTVDDVRTITCFDHRGRTAKLESIEHGVRITMYQTSDGSLEHTWEITNEYGSPYYVNFHKISRLDNAMCNATYTFQNGERWEYFDNMAQYSEAVFRDDKLNDPENSVLSWPFHLMQISPDR